MVTMAWGTACIWGFLLFTIGGLAGTLVVALCNAAKRTDEAMGIE